MDEQDGLLRFLDERPCGGGFIPSVLEAVLGRLDQVTSRDGSDRESASLGFCPLLGAEHDLTACLKGFQREDALQKILEGRRLARGRTARGLRVRHPVEVLEIEAKHGGDGPRRLGQIDEPVERQGGEELARELLIVSRRQADRGSVGAGRLSWGSTAA